MLALRLLALLTLAFGAWPAAAQWGGYAEDPRYQRAPQQPPRVRARDPYTGGAYPGSGLFSGRQPFVAAPTQPGQIYYNPQTRQYYRAEPNPAYRGRTVSPERGYQRRYFEEAPGAWPTEARRPAPERKKVVRRPAPVAPAAAKPEAAEVEVEPSTAILVLGDALAELVGQGLDEMFEENLDVEVVRKTRGDSGLVRPDHYDWAKQAQEALASTPKAAFAVLMMGSNERQPIREGETSHEPFSDRWREIYRERVDAMLKPLIEKRIPFLWVGAPPMRAERASTDMTALNDIYRERVQRAGGTYVDIWPGFVSDENRYTVSGPDVNGQVAKLRTNDGVFFTRAGALKAAHFTEPSLKRLLEQRNGGAAVATVPSAPVPTIAGATPAQAANTKDVDALIQASLPTLPEPNGLPSLTARPRPLAGPVLPLTRPETSPGGALVTSRPKIEGEAGPIVERALRDGVAPPPRPGRADDFRWPPRS